MLACIVGFEPVTESAGNDMNTKLSTPAHRFAQVTSPVAILPLLGVALVGCSTLVPQSLWAQTNSSGRAVLSRVVRVNVSRGTLFLGPMVVRNLIDLKGNNVLVDSFDSSNPMASTNGQYDPAKAGDKGDVYTNLGLVNSMNVGNANIYGHAHTGPGGGVYVGPNGAVGAHSWQANNSGIESGWLSDDSNFTFPETLVPYASGLTPAGGNVLTPTATNITTSTQTSTAYPGSATAGSVTTNITSFTTVSLYPNPVPTGLTTNLAQTTSSAYPSPTPSLVITNLSISKSGKISYSYTYLVATYTYPNLSYTYSLTATNVTYSTNYYDHILNSADYYATSLSGSTIVLGQARLVLPNGLNQQNKDTFTVAPGGSVNVYSDGSTCTIGGGGVNNASGLAANFTLCCTTNVTSFTVTATASFVGVLIAPSANVVMSGGGNGVIDFCGAVMANSVKMNGHYKFHFDESLNKARNGRYLITSWNEIALR